MRFILTRRSKWPLHGGVFGLVLLTVALGFSLKGSNYLFPGPLTGMQPHGEPLGGFASHAEFEQDCGHCHAPVHCFDDARCQDCHHEIAEQRMQAEGLHARLPGTNRCQDCHPEHMGREAVITQFAFANVDHAALAGFSLAHHTEDFAGEPLNCESCHQQGRFTGETLDCLTCHAEADHDFSAEHLEDYGPDCLACHDGYDRMRDFDHDASYVLDGAHTETACGDCHTDDNYATGPLTCAGCHADSAVHPEVFGLDCARCHTTTAWLPAGLRVHVFRLDHGGEGLAACETCHVDNYYTNTCYGCHDHTPEEMQVVHRLEGVEEIDNCTACHPTGEAGEADRLRSLEGANP